MIGNEDGTISFWNMKKGQQIYVLKAHNQDITRIQWFEDKNYLLSASKEKSIKVTQ